MYIITEVKGVPGKIAFIYEYRDTKGILQTKVVLANENVSGDDIEHIEAALNCNFPEHSNPKLIAKKPITVEITRSEPK